MMTTSQPPAGGPADSPDSSRADRRAAAAAILRAVADLIEAREDIAEPSVSVHFILSAYSTPDIPAAVTAIASALPCQWRARISPGSSGDWLDLSAATGKSGTRGTDVQVSARAEEVCTASGTKTVTTWAPRPAITRLLSGRPVEGAL